MSRAKKNTSCEAAGEQETDPPCRASLIGGLYHKDGQ